MHPSRQQQMRRLAPEERHGFRGVDRNAHDRSCAAADPARQIDRKDRRTVGVDRLDHLKRIALDRPVEAGAEQRIDDQRRLADRLRIERQHRIFPAARRQRRITLQAVALAQKDDRDIAAACSEFRRRHKTITAIVAAPGDHHDRSLLDEIHRDFGNGLPCAHHQREAGRAGGDGQSVGTLHLSGGQNFHAESSIQSPFPEAYFASSCGLPFINCT